MELGFGRPVVNELKLDTGDAIAAARAGADDASIAARAVLVLGADVLEEVTHGVVNRAGAAAGVGGPVIRIEGLFSDFTIRGDSEPEEE
jgi:hypothetical protein